MVKTMKEEKIKKVKYIKLEREKIKILLNILSNYYPDATCSLEFKEPIELVVALILAAQCTDERVNK